MNRRRMLARVLLALAACLSTSTGTAQDLRLDVLVRGGRVIDGTGSEAARADVGIRADRIVFVGDAAKRRLTAARSIDASGLIVAPGFIDPHTHAGPNLANPKNSHNQPYLYQGVTTVFAGNDGDSPLPIGRAFEQWQHHGVGTNVALFAGHGTVRRAVMGMSDAAPAAEQLEKMKALVRQAMEEGALGLSTNLDHVPGSFATTEEVIELAKVAGEYGGIYDTHLRSENSSGAGLLGAIREALRIGREAGLPVHISHIKIASADIWGQSRQAAELIDAARAKGLAVTANQYPYLASAMGFHAAVVPPWAQAGGRAELLKRIDDVTVRPKLIAEVEERLRLLGGPDAVRFRKAGLRGAMPPDLAGKTLADVAAETGRTPVEAALAVVRRLESAPALFFNMSQSDSEHFMRQDWVMTGSDGILGHPRMYGTFPRKIREYVFNRKILSLPAAIRASSALTAETFGLAERGKIREGYFADIVVFDETTISDRATYEEPTILPTGIRFVLVNGRVVIDEGEYNGTLAGKMLRKR